MTDRLDRKAIADGLIDGMRAEVVRLKHDHDQDVEIYVTANTLMRIKMYQPILVEQQGSSHWINGLRTHVVMGDEHPPFRVVAVDMAHKKGA